jgi:hypothetical protein
MDSSGHIFVVDVGTCHLRKITYANQVVYDKNSSSNLLQSNAGEHDSFHCLLRSYVQVAHPIGCTTLATEIIRPSGCSSYDPPVDKRDLTVSASFGMHELFRIDSFCLFWCAISPNLSSCCV